MKPQLFALSQVLGGLITLRSQAWIWVWDQNFIQMKEMLLNLNKYAAVHSKYRH